jgi:hypothetical protein
MATVADDPASGLVCVKVNFAAPFASVRTVVAPVAPETGVTEPALLPAHVVVKVIGAEATTVVASVRAVIVMLTEVVDVGT